MSLALACLSILAVGAGSAPAPAAPPRVDHLLFEVANLDASIHFYRDAFGLELRSRTHDFAMLAAGNTEVALWQSHWDWEAPRKPGERLGLGLYPHLEVPSVERLVAALRAKGVRIVQAPRSYDWGTEAFVADPDGYVWALVALKK